MTRRVVFTTMQMLKKKGGDTEVCLQSSKIHPNLQNLISSSCDFTTQVWFYLFLLLYDSSISSVIN